MPHINPNDIHNIRDFDTLLDFLRDRLGWNIPEDVVLEDVAFPWSAEDLDLDESTEELVIECQQLPPFPPTQPTLGLIENSQPWGIFFLQFNSESFYRTALRRVLRGLVERRDRDPSLPAWEHDQLLFICTTTDYQRFAFAHFASNENWRRSVLSIFSWEQNDTYIRTLCQHNLPALSIPSDGFSDNQQWLEAWQSAFDVEMVTGRFFQDYQSVFANVESAIDGISEDETETRRLYTQRLFNRLMFLRFIEKKGWLSYNEDRNYLRALYDATGQDEDYLNDRLYWAFFNGLGAAGGGIEDPPEIIERRGEVPFLNGGLFEMQEYDQRNTVQIPNEIFAEILNLFERYNFTATESTPLDVEVAVDPEMLGKVFEELVTGRHESGSYYTPRPVVSFMCKESLKICLQNGTEELHETIQQFVDDGDATEIRDPESVLQVLQTLRICDPACGSGAYLLGMMSELLRLREALFRSNQIDSPTIYQRKLDIIQNNLYGVDKDEFAVNIAMLRLWLSLAVDYSGEIPEPLPNLDYKIATGDSLLGPAPSGGQITFARDFIQQIQEHQAEYLVTHNYTERLRLREAIAALREQLEGWQENPDGFVWEVEFPEVFQEGGFDVVIGNPPYVRQEEIIPIKPLLQKLFHEVFTGKTDLYVYFYKRGTELLRKDGILTYISSNSFLRAEFGKKLRVFFKDKVCLHKILNFGSIPVFKAGVDTCIILIENTNRSEQILTVVTISKEEDISRLSDAFQELAMSMKSSDLTADGWTLTSSEILRLLIKLQQTGISLEECVDGIFYRGVVTGCDAAFIIDDIVREQLITEDAKSNEIIKPVLRGRNLKKWKTSCTGFYLIFTRHGIDIERYPAIKQYLSPFRLDLEPKYRREQKRGRAMGNYKWYEIQANTAYYQCFDKPKIIYPETAKSLYGCYDETKTFGLKTTYILPTKDLSILAILNSRLFDWYARNKFQSLNNPWDGGRLLFKRVSMKDVPIADRSEEQKTELSVLVEQILEDPESDQVRDIERKIDDMVYQLYGLSDAEIELIKQTYRDAGMEI